MTRWLVVAAIILAGILVPFFVFEARFNQLADELLHGGASVWYVGTVIAALLASDVFLPIPSSVVAAGAGVALGFWRATAVIWLGMTLACVIGYAFGFGTAGAAERFVGPGGMARARGLWERFGDYAIVFCRPVPVLAEASVIFAGIARRPFGHFLSMSAWSNLGVAMGYAAIGAFSMRVESFLLAFAGSLLVPGLAMLASRRWLRTS
jgi:membrane protein DedA with SNARE-associated domain